MNKIEKLIQEYCPDGVELVKLGELVKVLRGRRLTKSLLSEYEKFPVYHGGLEPLGYYGQYNRESNSVMVINVGASAGTVGYSYVDFWSSDGCFCIEHSDLLLSRFIYYALIYQENIIKSQVRFAGIPTLDASVVENINIPIPPLPVQQEIVNILDKFNQLEDELNVELDARRKQYDFYLNQLMGFEIKDVEWSKISEIGKCFAGATPKTSVNAYWENGTIPWMSSGEVNSGNIYETEKKITKLGFDNSSTKMIPSNSVVIALAGQGKTRGTVAITRIPLCTNQSLCAVVTGGRVNSDFLYYYLKTQYSKLRNLSSGEGTRGGLNLQMIGDFKIPIPPLSEQERIVSILDKFDALVNDTKVGIPAEIEARRKQYAYYRNKLLTFGEYA